MIEDIEFTLSLIRHGESEINATPDIIGQTFDTKLTEKGKEQARKLRARFIKNNEKFDYIYSSPYVRAFDTANLAKPVETQKVILAPDMREYDAGDWTGASRSKTITPSIREKMNILNHGFLPPNGESSNMVERRASTWLDYAIIHNQEIIEFYSKKESGVNIVCFSHGMTIKCLLHFVMGFDKSLTWKININNTSITKISFGKYGWSIDCINDVAHLEA